MEKWISHDKINIRIELIDSFVGGNREVIINFTGKDKNKYTLYFDYVYDFRYAIENAFISRVSKMSAEILQSNSIFTAEESDYFKSFEHHVDGTISMKDVKHIIVFDAIDTGIEILTNKEPILAKT